MSDGSIETNIKNLRQELVNAEGKLRVYFLDETPRQKDALDKLCQQYHEAFCRVEGRQQVQNYCAGYTCGYSDAQKGQVDGTCDVMDRPHSEQHTQEHNCTNFRVTGFVSDITHLVVRDEYSEVARDATLEEAAKALERMKLNIPQGAEVAPTAFVIRCCREAIIALKSK